MVRQYNRRLIWVALVLFLLSEKKKLHFQILKLDVVTTSLSRCQPVNHLIEFVKGILV